MKHNSHCFFQDLSVTQKYPPVSNRDLPKDLKVSKFLKISKTVVFLQMIEQLKESISKTGEDCHQTY